MEGTENPEFLYQMMLAEYRTTHSEEELRSVPMPELRLNYWYSRARDQRMAKHIAAELAVIMAKMLGGNGNG